MWAPAVRSVSFLKQLRALFWLAIVATLASGCGGDSYDGGAPPPPSAAPPPPAPTIELVPLAGVSVNRTTTLTAQVNASAGVTRVEFLVDGTVVGMTDTPPYSFDWDTSAVADGPHAVTARVTDANNNVVTSAPLNVTVNNHPTIAVTLSPAETYPPPASSANGSGELTFDLLTGAVNGGVNVVGITPTLAHIHRGYAGTAGPVIVDFVQSASDPARWEPQTGSVLSPEQIADLLAGRLYVNVHSAAYPQGEIRGQIRPDNVQIVIAVLDGASVVPPVTTGASGVAATTVDTLASNATVHLNTAGADDANEAHVHQAPPDANADTPFFSLTRDIVAPSHWFAELQPITSNDHAELTANHWYVDVHTPANPGGVLRGQVIATPPAPQPPGPPPPPAVTLTQLQSTVFGPVCSVCHSGQGTQLPGVLNLTSAAATHAALVNVPSLQQPNVLRVAPNDPAGSYLVRKIEGTPGITGSRMPLGGPFLDQGTIDQVRAWISAGAQNN